MADFQTSNFIIPAGNENAREISVVVDAGTGTVLLQTQMANDTWFTENTLSSSGTYVLRRVNCPPTRVTRTGNAQFYVLGARHEA